MRIINNNLRTGQETPRYVWMPKDGRGEHVRYALLKLIEYKQIIMIIVSIVMHTRAFHLNSRDQLLLQVVVVAVHLTLLDAGQRYQYHTNNIMNVLLRHVNNSIELNVCLERPIVCLLADIFYYAGDLYYVQLLRH